MQTFILRAWLLVGVAACSCTRPPPPEPAPVPAASDAERRRQVEADEQLLRSGATAYQAQQSPAQQTPPEPTAAGCFKDISTFIEAHDGHDCASYRWKLKPSSRRCVTACDDNARYAEAVQQGRDSCESLCANLQCGHGAFVPPEKCDATRCFPGISLCDPTQCPDWNSCYLFHAPNTPWNCSCVST